LRPSGIRSRHPRHISLEDLTELDRQPSTDLVVLVPKEAGASPLLLQRVPEPKSGKNRLRTSTSWSTTSRLR
jgi:hypothetical protein